MLKTIDRIQIATPNAAAAAAGWREILGAEFHARDTVRALGAKRTTCRLGHGFVEFLEADGTGMIADALAARGRGHLFAAGVSTEDLDELVSSIRDCGADPVREGDQIFLNPARIVGADCPLVVSRAEELPGTGLIDILYEVTLLTPDARATASRFARLFNLDEGNFVPIESDHFGYSGVLTLFDPNRLHRLEIITPEKDSTTMGRFFARTGAAYYMCFGEAAQIAEIESRVRGRDAGITVDRPAGRNPMQPADQLWIHPPALGGVMLGVSRPTMAWKWSGSPERVEELK